MSTKIVTFLTWLVLIGTVSAARADVSGRFQCDTACFEKDLSGNSSAVALGEYVYCYNVYFTATMAVAREVCVPPDSLFVAQQSCGRRLAADPACKPAAPRAVPAPVVVPVPAPVYAPQTPWVSCTIDFVHQWSYLGSGRQWLFKNEREQIYSTGSNAVAEAANVCRRCQGKRLETTYGRTLCVNLSCYGPSGSYQLPYLADCDPSLLTR